MKLKCLSFYQNKQKGLGPHQIGDIVEVDDEVGGFMLNDHRAAWELTAESPPPAPAPAREEPTADDPPPAEPRRKSGRARTRG